MSRKRCFSKSPSALRIVAEKLYGVQKAEGLVGRKATSKDFEPATWAVGLLGRRITAAEFCTAIRVLQHGARQVGPFFETYDVLLTPTLGQPPPVTGFLQPARTEAFLMKFLGRLNAGTLLHMFAGIEELANRVFEFIPYTALFNVSGQPAMSVPLHWNGEGLPVGMHFVGRYGDEATLFRLAGQLETAAPWFNRMPPIHGTAREE